jgi:uncharacterized protein
MKQSGHALMRMHPFTSEIHMDALDPSTATAIKPTPNLLDNTHVIEGRYIAHVAVPCRNVDEAARWYAGVLGAAPVRILNDRVTFSVGGILQLVCHLEKRAIEPNPRAYPRHFGLTFLRMDDFHRLQKHLETSGVDFLLTPRVRFEGDLHEHLTLMVVDPSANVVEFKCYIRPECSY